MQPSLRQIKPSQFIQAHTVLKTVVDKYADAPVLVLGGRNDDLRKVAEGHVFVLGMRARSVLTHGMSAGTASNRSTPPWT